MTYTQMPRKSNGDSVSARDWNQIIDNFNAGIPGAMTAKGDLISGTGADYQYVIPIGVNNAYLFADTSPYLAGMTWSLPGRLSLSSNAAVGSIGRDNLYAIDWFNIENFDTAGAFTGYTYTAKHPGYYLVTARINLYAPTFSSTWTKAQLALYKSGSLYCYLGSVFLQLTATGSRFDVSVGGSCLVYLSAYDFLQLTYYSDHASNMTVYKNPSIDYWDIIPIL